MDEEVVMRILLIHGMGRTPLSLGRLARVLRHDGHDVERLGYIAAIERFGQIRDRIHQRLERLAASGESYAVVGHSLGGLLLRAALDGITPAPRHLIMLATPNQSPRLAQRLRRFWPYRLICGESGQLLAHQEFLVQIPEPSIPYTIIAGTAGPRGRRSPFGEAANDWVVAVEETKLHPGDKPVSLPVGHTFMMNDRRVHAVIREVLRVNA
jgi:hypothetical protein